MKRIMDDDVQFLLQYITINLIARGYTLHSLTLLPERKQDKWSNIVENLSLKYCTRRGESIFDLSRDQRARRKKNGLMNAALVWWRNQLYIVATNGRDETGLLENEKLTRWPSTRLQFPVSKTFVYEVVQNNGQATVALSKSCFQDKLSFFEDAAKKETVQNLCRLFSELNHLMPPYAGCVRQKIAISKRIVKAARTAGRHDVNASLFPVGTWRKHVSPSI